MCQYDVTVGITRSEVIFQMSVFVEMMFNLNYTKRNNNNDNDEDDCGCCDDEDEDGNWFVTTDDAVNHVCTGWRQ